MAYELLRLPPNVVLVRSLAKSETSAEVKSSMGNYLKNIFVRLFATTLLLCPVLAAQSLTTGGVSGLITDPTGALVPNASITLRNVDTGASQTGTSDGSGEYQFSLLKPGHYVVKASQAGMEAVVCPFE